MNQDIIIKILIAIFNLIIGGIGGYCYCKKINTKKTQKAGDNAFQVQFGDKNE